MGILDYLFTAPLLRSFEVILLNLMEKQTFWLKKVIGLEFRKPSKLKVLVYFFKKTKNAYNLVIKFLNIIKTI